MGKLVASNIYRVLKMCPNCPFRKDGKAIVLAPGRLDGIKADLLRSAKESFNCHKTVYNLDLDMNPSEPQDLKMCAGAYEFLKEQGAPNLAMRLATAINLDTV